MRWRSETESHRNLPAPCQDRRSCCPPARFLLSPDFALSGLPVLSSVFRTNGEECNRGENGRVRSLVTLLFLVLRTSCSVKRGLASVALVRAMPGLDYPLLPLLPVIIHMGVPMYVPGLPFSQYPSSALIIFVKVQNSSGQSPTGLEVPICLGLVCDL